MSRRTTLLGGLGLGAGLAAPTVRGHEDGHAEFDVAVIGAGAAGIAAAEALLNAGRRVIVLEASSRAGGRAFTDTVVGIPFDAGAAYVHYYDKNPWVEIAARLKIPLEPHRGFGRGIPYRGGQRLDDAASRARRRGYLRFSDLLETVPVSGPDRSIADLVAGEEEAVRDAAQRYGNQALGEDPQRISVIDQNLLWEGDDLVVPGGYGALVAAEAQAGALPIGFRTPVRRIDWSGEHVAVETDRGTLTAAQVVITVSVGVLAAGGIAFTPELPPAYQDALDGLQMGALSKVALAFDGERFGWPSPSDAYDIDGGMNFEFWPFGRDIVIATFGGDNARTLTGLGEAGAVDAVMERFVGIVGAQARTHLKGGRLAGWWANPFTRGAYAVAKPGRVEARMALSRPLADRIHFAGEATGVRPEAAGAAMTVGGATLAGRAVARRILAGRKL